MYWRPWRWSSDSWYGAWVAAILSGLLAEAGFWANAPLITVAGLTGIAFGGLVAGRRASAVLAGSSFAAEGLAVGFRAGVLALVAWYLGIAVATLLFQTAYSFGDRILQVVYGAVAVPAYGVIFGGPFALLGGIVGALALRTLRRLGRAGTRILVAASVVVIVAGIAAVVAWLWPGAAGSVLLPSRA